MVMMNALDNKKVREIISDILLNERYDGELINGFFGAITQMNSSYYFTDGKSDFVSYSIKGSLYGRTVTLFKKVMRELGYECKFNNHGDCIYTYVGK